MFTRPRLLACTMLLACPAAVGALTDEEVGVAIVRMKAHFYRTQSPDLGHWEGSNQTMHEGGQTALVVLAMLIAGESSQNPALERAIQWLSKVSMSSTYAVAVRAHVWSHMPSTAHERLKADAAWLLNAAAQHERGLFDYESHPTGRIDHSVTQYGCLGLWEAAKRGVPVPKRFWTNLAGHFLKSQKHDGGWDYSNCGPATGSMTAAGLTALLICRQQLWQDPRDRPQRIDEAIDRGTQWLDSHFDGARNPPSGNWLYYYLVSVERAALAGGIRHLNGQDWYEAGARHIVAAQSKDPASPSFGSLGRPWETAFALMFLARGRYPVWVSKLALPGYRWNSHPNDIYQLTEYLSDVCEQELNWQIVSVDSPPQSWLNAPLLYLTGADELELSDLQQVHLKQYLQLGGLLVANAENGSSTFKRSIHRLAQALFPDRRLRPLTSEHPVFRSVRRLKPGTGGRVLGLSNGLRELILLAERDWASELESPKQPHSDPRQFMTNLYAHVTNGGRWPGRLSAGWEGRIDRAQTGQVIVARPRHEGRWLPEPPAWSAVGNRLFNRSGLALGVVDVELETLGADAAAPDLVHLVGTNKVRLNDLQLTAIERYARGGGTVLVETVAGRGGFARAVEEQLEKRFHNAAVPVDSKALLLSGDGMEGAYDARQVHYRRRAAAILSARRRPRLAAFHLGDRPAVLISAEDMTMAMLGVRHLDVLGYEVESGRRLAVNLLLWAHQHHQSEE